VHDGRNASLAKGMSMASKKEIPKQAEDLKAARKHASLIVRRLAKEYPVAKCALEHDSPFQLLIATILSAQCTDERVNLVTKELFAQYPDAHALARAPLKTVEKIIQSAGFFRMKAKNIVGCSQKLVELHGGKVPKNMEDLVVLPGVGRKTANVVLGTAYGIPTGVVVDTHVTRLSQRLGMTTRTDAVKIEQDLMRSLPETEWIDFSHRLIHHGRRICKARKPLCSQCVLLDVCPKVGVTEHA
jgi:endonuclease-3